MTKNDNVVTSGSQRFVLVHGAFHGGWAWKHVEHELRLRGHRVESPDLPGSGGDTTPPNEVTLELAVRRVIDVISSSPEPVVLVGHSMGGVIITAVASKVPDLVSRLVYVAAFRPRDGDSLVTLKTLVTGEADLVQENISVDGEPAVATFNSAQAAEVFYGDLTTETIAANLPRLCPQALALFTTPVKLAAPISTSTDYVLCTEDRAIVPKLQRIMAEREPANVFTLQASHSPMFSKVRELTDIIAR